MSFEWKKAGRPRTVEKPKWLEQAWTKDEMSLATTEKASVLMLAMAVVRQWIRDGKPKSDYEGVLPWISIIKDSAYYKNDIGGLYD